MFSPESRRNTLLILIGSISLLFVIRLFFLQVVQKNWKEAAANMSERQVVKYPSRGLVYDRNGNILVANTPVYDLMVVPEQFEVKDSLAFAEMVGLSLTDFKNKLADCKKYSRKKASSLVKQIPADEYARISEKLYKYKGIYGQPRTLRNYPYRIAAHTMGYISEVSPRIIEKNDYYQKGDYIGANGLERKYEDVLRGEKGVNYVVVDVHNNRRGKFQDGEYDKKSVAGKNITSTIDADLQAYAEYLMQNKKGAVVAIEPKTGEVLTMLTNPTYDPNLLIGRVRGSNYMKLLNDTLNPLFNRALMSKYPPGSTFKLINALIGLQEGVLDTNSKVTCNRGYYYPGGKVGCHAHRNPVDFNYSIQTSCNGFYCNAFKLILDKYKNTETSYKVWTNYLKQFGLGDRLGIDLPNESPGFVPQNSYFNRIYGKGSWYSSTIISLAIGQGELGVTPLQMANYCAILANRGFYIKPHLVKNISDTTLNFERFDVDIDKEHFEKVVTGMRNVVKSGTGYGVDFDKEIPVCGKTGTAQNPHGKDHSIFIAFAPKDDPKIAVAVYVENVGFGSTWAAPISSLMIEKYLKGEISRPEKEKKIAEANLY